jgi:hypothetical protein
MSPLLGVGQAGGVEVGYGVLVSANRVELTGVDVAAAVFGGCDSIPAHPAMININEDRTYKLPKFRFI